MSRNLSTLAGELRAIATLECSDIGQPFYSRDVCLLAANVVEDWQKMKQREIISTVKMQSLSAKYSKDKAAAMRKELWRKAAAKIRKGIR